MLLFTVWQDDDLELLKKSSRLIHSVSTPFIVSPVWRREALSKHYLPKRHDSQPDIKQVGSIVVMSMICW